MDPSLRRAWTEIVTVADYEQHMANIGQAQAAAALTAQILEAADPPAAARIVVAGAGTGQLFDFLNPDQFRSFRLTCTDLNPSFLHRLQQRLQRFGLPATILVDDIEHTALEAGPDLLLATLLLEHIDWRRGVEALAGLRPATCALIIQENPAGMASAVTPGRRVPPSIAKAVEIAHPVLIPRQELVEAFQKHGYESTASWSREVADGKRLVAIALRKAN